MELDGVVVATPPATHYEIAKDLLEHGLHVMIEKPMTLQRDHALALIDLARERNLVLMVGHAFEYNVAVQTLKVMIHAPKQIPMPGHDLTDRSRSVLALMIEGLNNTQIAHRLVVNPSTIKSHVSNILSKLNVSCRTEAVAMAVRFGLLS